MRVQVPLPPWRTVLAGLIAVEIGLVGLHLIGLAADSALLKLSAEDNIATWFSSAQFLLAGLACWVASRDTGPARTAWIALALILTAFSADEIARFHERFEEREGTDLAITVLEPVLALAVLGIVWSIRRHIERQTAVLLAAAMGAIVTSQAISTAVEKLEPTGAVLESLAMSEEIFEMLTGAFTLTAALVYIGSRQSSKNA
jgi:hypothetical protein